MIKSRIYDTLVEFLKAKQPTKGSDIFLQNGVNIQGVIEKFDNYGIQVLSDNQSSVVSSGIINTITVHGEELIDEALAKFEGFENGDLHNSEIHSHVCVPATTLGCEVAMFFFNRIHISGELLHFDGDVMLILGTVYRNDVKVRQLQMVNIDNLVTCSVKAPAFKF
ncbi:RNA chaperone Hfq [Vibrio splendidus]|nr:RNA chaperone Hfq [Vibrio splendidus]MCC4882546.1 RNA chaperone Hfq [Vibrio splendidus]